MDRENRKLCQEFDRVAAEYDMHAAVHQKMAYRLLQLPSMRDQNWQNVLEISCRTGYLTQLMLERWPQTHITAYHFSVCMAAIACSIIDASSRVEHLYESNCLRDRQGQYDLVIANAIFHRLACPHRTLLDCHHLLESGGCLVGNVFGPQTLQELRIVFQQSEEELGLSPEEHILPFFKKEFWEDLLQRSGYMDIQIWEYWWRQEAFSCEQILRTIKGMGERALCNQQRLADSYRLLRRVLERYDRAYRSRKGVYATIHVIQFVAYK